MDRPVHPRLTLNAKRVTIATIALAAYVYFAFVLTFPERAILSILSDDAFYYFKIARNITAGLGPTFDGIAPTNGFHPLWMVMMIVIFAVAGASDLVPVVMVMWVCGALLIGTLLLLRHLVDARIAPGFGMVSVAAFLLPNLLNASVNGMETSLQLFALTGFLIFCYRRRLLEPDQGSPFLLGVCIGVVTLCRLDSVFLLAAAILLARAGRRDAKTMFGRIARMTGGFLICLLPYFVWNLVAFGHLTPISGRAKSAFPALVSGGYLHGDKALGALMIAVLLALIGAAYLIDRSRGERVRLSRSPLFLLAVASVVHFANVALFLDWGVYWWHFTMYGLGIVIALAQLVHRVTAGRPALATATIAVIALSCIVSAAAYKSRELRIRHAQHAGWLQAARWAKENTDPDAVIAIVDAGLFGYYSQRRVINLDGKANGYAFLDAVNDDRVGAYLARAGTGYIANIRVDYRDGRYRIPLPRVNRQTVGLVVLEEWEVFRSDPVPSDAPRFGSASDTRFVIWKLPDTSLSRLLR